jgi:hypothetical protein
MKVFIFIRLTGLVAAVIITTTTMGTLSPYFDFKKKQGMITSTSIQTSQRRVEGSLPADPRFFFVHIGKTGGMTLRDSVLSVTMRQIRCAYQVSRSGKDHGQNKDYRSCYSDKTSQLDKHTLGRFHLTASNLKPEEREWMLDNTNVFLFSVRDPISRLVAEYNYNFQETYDELAPFVRFTPEDQKKLDKFYRKCFPDGFDAMIGRIARIGSGDEDCRRLGVETLTASVDHGGGTHFRHGYQYYMQKSLKERPTHKVAVIRAERLWEDTCHLDKLLGGTGEFEAAKNKHARGSADFSSSVDLSNENTRFLCCMIWEEIEAYQTMILKAVNLDSTQKLMTLSSLLNRCLIDVTFPSEFALLEEPFNWEAFRHSSCAQLGYMH